MRTKSLIIHINKYLNILYFKKIGIMSLKVLFFYFQKVLYKIKRPFLLNLALRVQDYLNHLPTFFDSFDTQIWSTKSAPP
jgi:hypothetical protein